ncbi:MAG: deoxyribose-phosphate aldolase [Bacteroidota bacterium]|nr:deoxyribose-phosphate aldolase [Bacteroidota bacterium]
MEFIKNITDIDAVQLQKRVDEIVNKNLPEERKTTLRKIISFIDLTSLGANDTEQKIIDLCEKAKNTFDTENQIPSVGAVCVYPTLVQTAKKQLKNTTIPVAAVSTSFPSGMSPLFIKETEVKYAIEQGADEIDMVISRGKFLDKKYQEVFDEIKAIKKTCGDTHLKVILETGELESPTNVSIASKIAIEAGGDFIKTSTGKINPAATQPEFLVMLDAIKEHHEKTGKKIGIKPAGGISDNETAIQFYKLVYFTLGKEWMNNKLFRIGASRLASNVISEIKG